MYVLFETTYFKSTIKESIKLIYRLGKRKKGMNSIDRV